jgi:hypothetical protein
MDKRQKVENVCQSGGQSIGYQTAYASETATLNEAVIFEYSDASRMSQRLTKNHPKTRFLDS